MAKIRKVIPALDVTDTDQIGRLLRQIDDNDLVYGYKVGFSLGLLHGLPQISRIIRQFSQKPIIYDHQKAATDIPDTGKLFARIMKESAVDEVILFPQAGPATLKSWIEAVQNVRLKVIVGGIMTHPQFVISEGGFIRDEAVVDIYRMSHALGVQDFVVPLTKPQATEHIYQQAGLDERCVFYSPGFGKQGGAADRFAFIQTHYMIIGRSLLSAEDPQQYLQQVEEELNKI